jgi:4-amino-4-deoxy-L-arabinose transferase-like glycosyltransferase
MAARVRVLLFALILALGIFARTWEFRSLPPGLNEDEASSGVDAFSLYRFGVDRNGVSFPIFMVSWGSGQSALPAYAMLPFIALGGLSPLTVRLPALIAGILTLPVVFFIGRRTAGADFALAAMFLLAISPWHILISRWGFEGNLLPFVFSVAYLLLLKSTENDAWFIPAMLFMGLCLYTYGPAYAAVPLFLLFTIPILVRIKKVRARYLIPGLLVLFVVSLPIALFLLVNTLRGESIHLGLMTIPRLPAQPRYETISAVFHQNALQNLFQNLKDLGSLLWQQEDGFFFNTVQPYGYFYSYSLPLEILGAVLLLPIRRAQRTPGRQLLMAWLIVCIVLGVLESVNLGRINLIFIPLIFCLAAVLKWIAEHSKIGLWVAVCIFLAAFVLFTRDYHGPAYRSVANREYSAGLLPAIDFASQPGDHPVCITKSINMPYIYVLFSQRLNPKDYLPGIKYVNPRGAFRQVRQLDRYSFGLNNCPGDDKVVYVLSAAGEMPPHSNVTYSQATFGEFVVYSPTPSPK